MGKYSNHPLAGARDLDSAINLFWNFYKKNFVALFIISLAGTLMSTFVTSNLDFSKFMSATTYEEKLSFYTSNPGPFLGVMVISLLLTVLLTVYITEKPAVEPFSIASYLKKTVVVILPYLASLVILAVPGVLLVSLGMMALVLPGVFAAFYVFTVGLFLLPVLIVEGSNPVNSLARSLSLTHKRFWQNIGWVVIVLLLILIMSFVASALIKLPFTGTFIKTLSDPGVSNEIAKNPLFIGLTSLVDALITPVYPILAAILYFSNAEEIKSEETIAPDENRVRVEDLYPKMPEDNEVK